MVFSFRTRVVRTIEETYRTDVEHDSLESARDFAQETIAEYLEGEPNEEGRVLRLYPVKVETVSIEEIGNPDAVLIDAPDSNTRS